MEISFEFNQTYMTINVVGKELPLSEHIHITFLVVTPSQNTYSPIS